MLGLISLALSTLVGWVYITGNRVTALEVQRAGIIEHLALIRTDIARVEQLVKETRR
jgi:hypothetical protein